MDPSLAVFLFVIPALVISGMAMIFVKGRGEQRATYEENKEMVKKDENLSEVFDKNPIPRNLSKDQGAEFKQMFKLSSDLAKKHKAAAESTLANRDEKIEAYNEAELLNAEDLGDVRECSRQRKIILSLRLAIRQSMSHAARAVEDMRKQIEKSTLSAKTKVSMLKGHKKTEAKLKGSPWKIVVKRCDVELKILSLFENHGSSMTLTDSGGAMFSSPTVNEKYSRLKSRLATLDNEIENADFD